MQKNEDEICGSSISILIVLAVRKDKIEVNKVNIFFRINVMSHQAVFQVAVTSCSIASYPTIWQNDARWDALNSNPRDRCDAPQPARMSSLDSWHPLVT